MKKFLFGALAAAAVITPVAASAETNAVVGLQYTNTDFDGFDGDNYGFSGGFSHDLSNGAVLQMDGEWGRSDFGGCCIASSYGAVHYGVRNESYAFGGFAGLSDFYAFSGLGGGLEGQLFLGNLNLNGSVGYVDYDDADLSSTSAQIDAAYFVTPNFALTGLIATAEADFGSSDTDWTSYGVGGEYRFANSPVSVTLGYRNSDFDVAESDSWTIGFNFDLGTGSLIDRSRTGPGFNGAGAMFHNAGALPIT